ncbi:MAG: phage tail protein [Thermoflexales bacterium]
MSTPLVPTITEAGLIALWNAQSTGLAAEITHVALGDAAYQPEQSATALRAEKARYTVADGELLSPSRIHLTALADGPAEFWVREVGFFLDNGVLFAVWSHASTPLAYKAAGVDLLLAFDLELSAVPPGSVTVHSTGAGLSLAMADQVASLSAAAIDAMRRDLTAGLRLDALADAIARLDGRAEANEAAIDDARRMALAWPEVAIANAAAIVNLQRLILHPNLI